MAFTGSDIFKIILGMFAAVLQLQIQSPIH